MKQTKFITLDQAINLNLAMRRFSTYKPITLAKKIVGYSLIGIGTMTLPLPTGSIFLIMAGCALLAIDYKKLLNTINFYAIETFYFLRRLL